MKERETDRDRDRDKIQRNRETSLIKPPYTLQLSLTKNPKRRPTADKLLLHPFVAADLPKWLAVELLQKAHNPQHSFPPELEVKIFNLFSV